MIRPFTGVTGSGILELHKLSEVVQAIVEHFTSVAWWSGDPMEDRFGADFTMHGLCSPEYFRFKFRRPHEFGCKLRGFDTARIRHGLLFMLSGKARSQPAVSVSLAKIRHQRKAACEDVALRTSKS